MRSSGAAVRNTQALAASRPARSTESSGMRDRPKKITFADMREMDVRGLLIYCSDHKCSHHLVKMSAMADQMIRLRLTQTE
jgi:hypothetical protein